MDTASSKPPIKVWLLLGVVVLVLHLAVLSAFPLQMSAMAAQTAPMTFSVRTLPVESPKAINPTTPLPEPSAIVATPSRPPPPQKVAESQPSTVVKLPAEPMDDTPPEARLASNQSVTALAAASGPAIRLPAESQPTPSEAHKAMRTPHVDVVPASIKLIYEVQANKFPYSLNGELVWTQTNGGYQASLMFGAFGLKRSQTSRGQIGAEGLMPERFSDKFRSEVAAHFNRPLGKVTFSANTPDVPLLAGAQDRLSVLIQLAAMAASAPDRFTSATTLTIQTIGPRDADLWLFTVREAEPLTLPGGKLDVVKLTRNPRQTYDQQVDIWLAPSLGYLPARIRITESNGDYVDLKWLRSEPAQPS